MGVKTLFLKICPFRIERVTPSVKYFNDKTKGSNRLEDEILQLYENKEMVFLNCLSLQIQRFKDA